MLLPDGSLHRAKLRELVFEDPAERQRLASASRIRHPRLIRRVANAARALRHRRVPLLVETRTAGDPYDRVLVVDCDPRCS